VSTACRKLNAEVRHPVKIAERRELASKALAGYVSGPAAATQATAMALAKTAGARAIILVEGISDQIALETLAACRGRHLHAEGVVILPTGGIHAVTRYLRQFGPEGAGARLAGLCDAGEEDILRRGLATANVGSPRTRADMERLGFHVCVEDLEDELIRAVGAARVTELFDTQGDLSSFRSMQRQPAWRGRSAEAQMRRFLGAGSARKLRYARLLTEAVDLTRVPRPLDAVLANV
jgi:Overcoming lysogenization defect protein-like, TOPRIM domain